MKFGNGWQISFREKENNGYIHPYSPVTGADNPLRPIFSRTVLFSQCGPLLQVFLNLMTL